MPEAGGARIACGLTRGLSRGLSRVLPGQSEGPAADRVRLVSRGCVLVCGPAAQAVPAGKELARTLRVVVCATGTLPRSDLRANPLLMLGRIGRITGHLGRFTVEACAADNRLADLGPFSANRDGFFDLVLDLNNPPLLAAALPPAGYYAPGATPDAIAAALAELAGLVGSFDKPRYCHYEAAHCAHEAMGTTGCSQCLGVCPSGALRSAGGRIVVDPALCQGCAACTLVCPSGALAYVAAERGALFGRLERWLAEHGAAGRPPPALCLRESAGDAGASRPGAPELAVFVVPALAAAGADFWLTALAGGVPQVVLEAPARMPAPTRRALDAQLALAQALLAAVGESPARIVVATAGAPLPVLAGGESRAAATATADAGTDPVANRGANTGTDAGSVPQAVDADGAGRMAATAVPDKRAAIHAALDRLAAARRAPGTVGPEAVDLPDDASFGTVSVDPARCSVCLACAHVCPGRALLADEAARRLRFVESRCLQCGLCAAACPEQAIALRPRWLRDASARHGERTLAEDVRHACPGCGTPFVGAAVLERSLHLLQARGGLDAAVAARLRYCPACRAAPGGS